MPVFSSSVRERIRFEKKNKKENKSFREDGQVADYAFEISSEGELEQVKAIIEKLLTENYKIELIYCSKSVEKQCQVLADKYPKVLRTFRPL